MIVRLLLGAAAILAHLAPEPLKERLQREGAATLEEALDDARNPLAAIRIGLPELADIARAALLARICQPAATALQPPRDPQRQRRLRMFGDDLRQAVRRITARPATIVAAGMTLALGTGLTTSMFTIADALLIRPMPFRAPEQIAEVYMGTDRGGRADVSPAVLHAWRTSGAFEAVESANHGTALIQTSAGPIARGSALVTPGLFRMLDVRPLRGRMFDDNAGRAGTDNQLLLSEDLWRSSFAADPTLLGRSIVVDGQSAVVVGILPAEFRFPRWDTVVWRPIDYDAPPAARTAARPTAFVRFAAGIPQADALRLATTAAHGVDGSTASLRARTSPFAGFMLNAYYRRALPLLVGGVGLMFLVLCANVSSLLLVRLSERRREFSMCSALGASRGRLLRQALIESALLGIAGCAAGIGLSWALVAAARGFLPEAFLLRTLNPLDIDTRALAAATLSGIVATLAAGVLPAWIGTRHDPAESLRVGDRGGTETRAARTMTRALITVEIALACMLLVGATMLVRSFVNVSRMHRGLDSSGVMIATISLPSSALKDRASIHAITSSIDDAMRKLPGAQQVALTYGLPPDGAMLHFKYKWQPDVTGAAPIEIAVVEGYRVGADFFDLYRIPMVKGRAFRPGDSDKDVVLGERLANLLWPGMDPIGRSFGFAKSEYHVVGVAREINHPSIDPRVDRPELYHPVTASGLGGYFSLSMRCGEACPDGALIRERLAATSAAIRVDDVGPLDNVYFEQLAPPRAAAALAFVFAAIAVVGAAGGLFGVLSYAVGRRRREFGVRSALGATQGQIRRLVFADGLVIAAAGFALGSVAGWWLARGLASLRFGVTAADPASWSIVLAVLAATTVLAVWRPAHKAARIDPLTLLRDE